MNIERKYRVPCFSWEGEDVLAANLMSGLLGVTHKGRYVDIGAGHPIHMSNTYAFYQRGWRGINIDAAPGSKRLFDRVRSGDTNLEVGVASVPGEYEFQLFRNPMLNGILCAEEVEQHIARGEPHIGKTTVRCESINSLLEAHMKPGRFELLSIDVEGRDLEVLGDMDLEKWRPLLIISEILGCLTIEQVYESEQVEYLRSVGYRLFSRLHLSCLFLDSRSGLPL